MMKKNTNTCIITENIQSILDFYEEDIGIEHLNTDLFSNVSGEVFEPILTEIRQAFPALQFTYRMIDLGTRTCQVSRADLGIMIPPEILEMKSAKLKYDFQSNIKNVFGTMTFDLVVENASFKIGNLLIFATSIGE